MTKSKKPVKKIVKNVIVPFNKANTLALADMIFSDKGGVLRVLKLCDGVLSNGKDGGRTLHCAVGEAYFNFVNNDMRKIPTTIKNSYGDIVDYSAKYSNSSDCETAFAIDALVEKAQLQKVSDKNKLGEALAAAVDSNDGVCNIDDLSEYVERSRSVAEVFRNRVAPLLK